MVRRNKLTGTGLIAVRAWFTIKGFGGSGSLTEGHLERIRLRLGLRSRAQVAAWHSARRGQL